MLRADYKDRTRAFTATSPKHGRNVTAAHYLVCMSHNLTLYCGCIVYVACHPRTGVAHTRVLESRHPRCPVRKHEVGVRLAVWELLPDPLSQAAHALPPLQQGIPRGKAV